MDEITKERMSRHAERITAVEEVVKSLPEVNSRLTKIETTLSYHNKIAAVVGGLAILLLTGIAKILYDFLQIYINS